MLTVAVARSSSDVCSSGFVERLKVAHQQAAPAAKSDVYDCLVIIVIITRW